MSSLSDEVLRQLGGKSTIRPLVGTFVSASATGYVIDVGGGRIPAAPGSLYLPEVNESVWVWFIDGSPFVMGPTVPKPDRGTVASVASGIVSLTTSLGQVSAPYTGTTPSAGQIMKLAWHGGPMASLMSTSPAGNTAPPAPGGGTSSHVDTFTAVDSGSFGSGRWWTAQVYASDSNLGAWFYGTKISDTIPASAAVQKTEIYVPPGSQISGSAPNFATHTYASKPGGAPSLPVAAAVGIAPGWVVLPNSIGIALKRGGGSLGVGLNQGGYNILRSLAQDGQSGAIRITSVY